MPGMGLNTPPPQGQQQGPNQPQPQPQKSEGNKPEGRPSPAGKIGTAGRGTVTFDEL